jgi:cell division transport system permease protein
MIQRTAYFAAEALRNLWQFKARHLLSLTIICLSFLTVGIFFALSNNFQDQAREVSKNVTTTFFLRKDLPAAERKPIENKIRESRLFDTVRTISPEEAWERFVKDFPELKDILQNLGENPFPAAIEATLRPKDRATSNILSFIGDMKKNPGIEDVQYNRDWAERMRSLAHLVDAAGFFLGGILVLGAFFIISNVIKLNVLARRSEIEILRLVGATNSFIRIPFLLEGMLLGLGGSALSLVLVFLLTELLPLYLNTSLGAFREVLNFRYLTPVQVFSLVAGGGFVGFLGGLSSVGRFLRI